jgi:hypothetical protein
VACYELGAGAKQTGAVCTKTLVVVGLPTAGCVMPSDHKLPSPEQIHNVDALLQSTPFHASDLEQFVPSGQGLPGWRRDIANSTIFPQDSEP